jgi:hypothetical protein
MDFCRAGEASSMPLHDPIPLSVVANMADVFAVMPPHTRERKFAARLQF